MIVTLPKTARAIRSPLSKDNPGAMVLSLNEARRARAAEAPFSAAMIWQALQDGRVINHYQPQVDLATGRMVGAEALLRLVDDYGNWVFPDRFIDVAEANELIVPLGRAVIESACADLSWCRAQGVALPRVAINVSAKQLVWDTTLTQFVMRTLNRYRLEPVDLELEITERQGLVDKQSALQQLVTLVETGTSVVLDDFGVGYSSLHYLQHFPVSGIKLDRSLTSQLPHCSTAFAITRHTLAMAEDLGLGVIAEGIENSAQADCLSDAGCRLGQGYMYARPDAIDQLVARCDQHALTLV